MYGIRFDDIPPRFGSFPYFRTKREAEEAAQQWRADWPNHTYRAVRLRGQAAREAALELGA